jgi:hypothetical protein
VSKQCDITVKVGFLQIQLLPPLFAITNECSFVVVGYVLAKIMEF